MTEILKVMSYVLIAWFSLGFMYIGGAVLYDFLRRRKKAKMKEWQVRKI